MSSSRPVRLVCVVVSVMLVCLIRFLLPIFILLSSLFLASLSFSILLHLCLPSFTPPSPDLFHTLTSPFLPLSLPVSLLHSSHTCFTPCIYHSLSHPPYHFVFNRLLTRLSHTLPLLLFSLYFPVTFLTKCFLYLFHTFFTLYILLPFTQASLLPLSDVSFTRFSFHSFLSITSFLFILPFFFPHQTLPLPIFHPSFFQSLSLTLSPPITPLFPSHALLFFPLSSHSLVSNHSPLPSLSPFQSPFPHSTLPPPHTH